MGDGRGSLSLSEVVATTNCQWVSQATGQCSCVGTSPHTDQTVASSVADARVVTVQGGMSLIPDSSLYRLFHTLIFCSQDSGAIYVRCTLAGGWHVTLGTLQFRWNAVRVVWTVRCQSPAGCTSRSCGPLLSPDQRDGSKT